MSKWLGLGLLSLLSFVAYSQDLVVVSYDGRTTFSQYEQFVGTVTIKNDGIVPVTKTFYCEVYLSQDLTVGSGDILVGSKYISNIGAGETQSLQFKAGTFRSPPDNYNFIIRLDHLNYAQETNETNNQYVVDNVVVEPSDLDWQFVSLSVDSSSVMNNQPPCMLPEPEPCDTLFRHNDLVRPIFRIENNGVADVSGGLFSNYYLSADEVLDAGDVLIGKMYSHRDGQGPVTEGDPWSLKFMIPYEVKPGRYYVIGKVDPENEFSETNENNNTFVSAQIVTGKSYADISISSVTGASYRNGYLYANYSVTNSGTTGVGEYLVNAYLSQNAVLDSYDYHFPDDDFDDYGDPYLPAAYSAHGYFSLRSCRWGCDALPAGSYYLILSIEGVSETNYANNIFVSAGPLITIDPPPPVAEVSIASAGFVGAYDNTDKDLKLDITFTNAGGQSNETFAFDVTIKDANGVSVYQTRFDQYLSLATGQAARDSWNISLPNALPHGAYRVEITSNESGYAGSLYTVDLQIDIPTFAVAGTIQGEDGVPINQGKMFLYQKHDDGKVSFINNTVFTGSNNYSFLTDYHQHTLFYIPDPKTYPGYVPTIFGKEVTLKDRCFFSLTQNMDTVFEVLKVVPLASGTKTISGSVYTGTSPNGLVSGNAASRIEQLTGGEVESFPVILLSSAGVPLRVTTTDSNGHYEFAGLPDDAYEIVVAMELDKPVMQEPLPVDVTKHDAIVEFGIGEKQVQPAVKFLQEIIFNPLSEKTFGDAAFVVPVAASSALPVTLTSSDPKVAVIENGKVRILGAGKTVITASQPGTGEYVAATSVTQELVVKKALQQLTVAEIPAKTFGNPPFSLQISTSNANPLVTITSSDRNIANVSNNKIFIVRAGTVDLTVNVAGTSNYEAATMTRQLVINKQDQRITFEPLPELMLGDAVSLPLVANATSLLPVYFISDNEAVATINADNTLTIKGAGVANITAKQEGNFNFNTAFSVTRVLKVNLISAIEHRPGTLKVFPNPVTDLLTIEGAYPIKKVTVSDTQGRILDTVTWNEGTVDLQSLPSGLYMLKVEVMTGAPEIIRVIKQ